MPSSVTRLIYTGHDVDYRAEGPPRTRDEQAELYNVVAHL